MKKKFFILLLSMILLISCRAPNRPLMETEESSISDRREAEYCRIISLTTEVRSGLGHDFDSIGTLKQNDIVKVLEETDDWYVVRLNNNGVGSIDTQDAVPIVRDGPQQHQPTTELETPAPADVEPPMPPTAQTPTPVPNETETPAPMQRNEPSPVEGIRGLSSEEQQMLNLVNRAREENDLLPLQVDLELTRVARIKSQDMEDNNYFSHYSPIYGSPFEMMDSFGINYLHAGENLAGNSSVQAAHDALMNSSGHRQNILSPDFTHIGIGMRPSNRYGMLFTQMFISKPQ